MELNRKFPQVSVFIKKYRYVAIVIAIGLILILFPLSGKSEQDTQQPKVTLQTTDTSLEERLSSTLRLVDGAGDVHVIMSVAAGEEVVYQTNESQNFSDNSTNNKLDTVTVTTTDRSTTGLVKQIIPETYQGAVVICTGADDPTVRLAIVDAVSKLTGLGANQISVLKMK